MVFHPERRILWHPRHATKFAVGGSAAITLYDYSEEKPAIRHVTSHDDLQHMRCFAWSPDSLFDDLVAVGLSSGKIDLVRLERNRQAGHNDVLSRGASVTISTRSSRACNALSFSSVTPHLLACGLDKVRGDQSLVVWDLQAMQPRIVALGGFDPNHDHTLAYRSPLASSASASDTYPRTVLQTAPAEIVNAVAFLPSSDQHVLSGVSGRFLRMHDLRLGQATAAIATINVPCKVHAFAIDPLDHHRFAAWGDGIITLWDQRHLSSALLTFSSLDADPHAGGSPINLSMVEFSSERRGLLATLEKDAAHLRFWDVLQAPQIREESKESRQLGYMPKMAVRDASQGSRTSKLSWAGQAIASWAGTGSAPMELAPMPELAPEIQRNILANTWPSYSVSRPLSTFTLVPKSTHRGRTTAITVNKDGDLQLCTINDAPKHPTWSNTGTLAIGNAVEYRVLEPTAMLPSSPPSHAQHMQLHEVEHNIINAPRRPRGFSSSTVFNQDRGPQKVIDTDIAVSMRTRAVKGYGLDDAMRNSNICHQEQIEGSSTLSELWLWVDHSARLLSLPDSHVLGFNFALQGIQTIWDGLSSSGRMAAPDGPAPSPMDSKAASPISSHRTLLDAPSGSSTTSNHPFPPHGYSNGSSNLTSDSASTSTMYRRRSKLSRRSRSPADSVHGDFHDAVVTVLARSGIAVGSGQKPGVAWRPPVTTGKLPHRRLALELCAWDLHNDSLSASIARWAEDGQYSRAACWYSFVGQHSKVIDTLMKSNDESHFMLSGTITALMSMADNLSKRNDLRDHCERLVNRLEDPYLRAMVTQLTSGEWSDVLDEAALPLRERLAISLHFLDDVSLGPYLRRTADLCRTSGDIEGLLLTGLTPAGLDVLQSWLDSTGDVQTAAILASRVASERMRDRRVERWIDTYRELLDGWHMFHERCDFDVARGEIIQRAIHAGDAKSREWAPKQFIVRCSYCNKPLDAPASYDGRPTVCPSCKRPLPRCSICLLTLQVVPDSAKAAELRHHGHHSVEDDPLVICQSCRHGGHASHIMEWFTDASGEPLHRTCPIADCDCRCADEM